MKCVPYDCTFSCNKHCFLCNQSKKMNTHLLIHFLFSHSLLSTIHSGFCSTYYNCPHPILNSFLKYQKQVFCVLKIKQNTNKSNHILPCLKCPFLFRKMAKILSISYTCFSVVLTHQPFLISLDMTFSYPCSWLKLLLLIYTSA